MSQACGRRKFSVTLFKLLTPSSSELVKTCDNSTHVPVSVYYEFCYLEAMKVVYTKTPRQLKIQFIKRNLTDFDLIRIYHLFYIGK